MLCFIFILFFVIRHFLDTTNNKIWTPNKSAGSFLNYQAKALHGLDKKNAESDIWKKGFENKFPFLFSSMMK